MHSESDMSGKQLQKPLLQDLCRLMNLWLLMRKCLPECREIGPKIASSIISYFSDPENAEIIRRLKTTGIKLAGGNKESEQGNTLNGKIIVISGVFSSHTRDEYKEYYRKKRGKNSSSISGNTSFILAGDNMGPVKKREGRRARNSDSERGRIS